MCARVRGPLPRAAKRRARARSLPARPALVSHMGDVAGDGGGVAAADGARKDACEDSLDGPPGEDVFDRIARLRALRRVNAKRKRGRGGGDGGGGGGGDGGPFGVGVRRGSAVEMGAAGVNGSGEAWCESGSGHVREREVGQVEGGGVTGGRGLVHIDGDTGRSIVSGELIETVIKDRKWMEIGEGEEDEEGDLDDEVFVSSNVAYCLLCGKAYVGTRYAVRRHIISVHLPAVQAEIEEGKARGLERLEGGEKEGFNKKDKGKKGVASRGAGGEIELAAKRIKILGEGVKGDGGEGTLVGQDEDSGGMFVDGVGGKHSDSRVAIGPATGSDTREGEAMEVTESTASMHGLDSDSADDGNGNSGAGNRERTDTRYQSAGIGRLASRFGVGGGPIGPLGRGTVGKGGGDYENVNGLLSMSKSLGR